MLRWRWGGNHGSRVADLAGWGICQFLGVIWGVFRESVEGGLPAFRFRYREEKVAREPTSMPM